jgi:hypothetical protein
MATKIVTKNSSTASAVPTASDLVQGELAVNVADKRLFTEDNGGTIVELGTNPSTLTVTGEITANGGIALGDNDKATFGAGDDLEIYHDGSHSIIKDNGTGNLQIQGQNLSLEDSAGTRFLLGIQGGETRLYNQGDQKVAINSTGIDVTGTASMDGLTVGDGHTIGDDAFDNLLIESSSGEGIRLVDNHATNSLAVESNVGFVSKTLLGTNRFFVDHATGDISFYEDTGTTAKLFWDASEESLGIGTTSPAFGAISTGIEVEGTTAGIRLQGATTGALELYHNNGLSTIDSRAATGGSEIAFNTENTERMRIDSSGNVGIGTSSPQQKLDVSGAGTTRIQVKNTNLTSSGMYIGEDSNGQQILGLGAYPLRFGTNGSEAMRIDSSGNLLVGKSSAALGTEGVEARATGFIRATVDSADVLQLNRLSTDGDIIDFRKDGTTVGSIGTDGTNMWLGDINTGLRFRDSGDQIQPYNPSSNATRDAAIDLGGSSTRFKDLYLSGGVYLGGTGAANKLDDYEEGTWTPVYQSVTNPSGVTYDSGATYGSYTKVGNLVTVVGRIRTDGITSVGSGDLRIGGLPFTVSSSVYAPANLAISNAFASNNPITGYGNVGSTYIVLMYRSSITSLDSTSQCSDLSVGGNDNSVAFSMSYIV